LDVPELAILLDGVEIRQRTPDSRSLGILLDGQTVSRLVALAIRFGAFQDIIATTVMILVCSRYIKSVQAWTGAGPRAPPPLADEVRRQPGQFQSIRAN